MKPSVKKLLLFGSVAPYSGALLALDFVGSRTNGKPYYMLGGVNYPLVSGVPGWTYTGGTAAGTGSYAARSDGSLQFFPSYTNLLLQSQTFGTTWTTLNAAITSDAAVAPDGTTTADRLADNAVNNEHYVTQTSTIAASTAYTLSVSVKQGTARYIRLGFFSAFNGIGSGARSAIYDLQTGTVSLAPTAGANATASIASNGSYYRITLTATSGAAATTAPIVIQMVDSDGTTISYVGTGKYHDIWGAQLELGSTASTYIPTTTAAVTVGTPRITDAGYWAEEARTNLLTYSQQFDNASWGKSDTTVTADQTTAPDGTNTADLLTEGSAGTAQINQAVTISAGATLSVSRYFKRGNTDWVLVKIDSTGGANGFGQWFNLSTGAKGATYSFGTGAFVSATISSATNGFYNCVVTGTVAAAATTAAVRTFNTNGNNTEARVNGATRYEWQADLQAGSFATSPIPTTSVAVTRAADVGYVSGLVVPSALTLRADFSRTAAAATNFNGAASIGTVGGYDTNEIYITRHSSTAVRGYVVSAGTAKEALFASVSAGQDAISAALRAEMSNGGGAVGGTLSTGSQATSVVMPIGSSALYVGSRNGINTTMNGPIRRIVIYPRAFANSELQAITTAGAY